MGFTDGFARGYGIAANIEDRKDRRAQQERNNGRQDIQDSRRTELYNRQIETLDRTESNRKKLTNLNVIQYGFERGQFNQDWLNAVNTEYAPVINRGTPEGSTKRIIGAHPTKDGKGFVPRLQVTRPDGTSYEAPMTTGRGPNDAGVQVIPMDDFFTDLLNRRNSARDALQLARIQTGDNTPINDARNAKLAASKNSRADYVREDKQRHGLGLLTHEYGLKANLQGVKNKAKNGKGSSNLRMAQKDARSQLAQSMSGKLDASGNWGVPEGNSEKYWKLSALTDKITSSVPGIGGGEAARIVLEASGNNYISQDAALKLAQAEADDKAGYFSGDQSDFGMSREKWIENRAKQIAGEQEKRIFSHINNVLRSRMAKTGGGGVTAEERAAAAKDPNAYVKLLAKINKMKPNDPRLLKLVQKRFPKVRIKNQGQRPESSPSPSPSGPGVNNSSTRKQSLATARTAMKDYKSNPKGSLEAIKKALPFMKGKEKADALAVLQTLLVNQIPN